MTTKTTLPEIKSFLLGTDDDGENPELNLCISVPDALTATSVLGHIALLCAQYKLAGFVPTEVSTGEPKPAPAPTPPVAEQPSAPAKAAPPAATTTKRTAPKAKTTAKKAPTNKGSGAVSDVTKAAINPVAAVPTTPVAVVPAVKAETPASSGVAIGEVPTELIPMKTFSNVLLWLAKNVTRDLDELTKLVQKYRSHVPAIARTDSEDDKVRERIERGIGVLVARKSLEAA